MLLDPHAHLALHYQDAAREQLERGRREQHAPHGRRGRVEQGRRHISGPTHGSLIDRFTHGAAAVSRLVGSR